MNTNAAAAVPTSSDDSLADDLLRGVKPIAAFIGEPERRTFYLCEKGYIPVGKVGAAWVGSKKVLRAYFERITAGAR